MRASREVMAHRHDEIISQTAKMLRQRGIGGTSLADLMAAAGLTHGGFYKHFDSKDVLVAEATKRIFAEINSRFEARAHSHGAKTALKLYVADYLMTSHVRRPELGCPIPSFGPDVAREDELIRRTFANGMKTTLSLVSDGLSCPESERRGKAIELLSLLTGAVLMARAAEDAKLVTEIIASTEKRATKLIDERR